MRFNDRARPPDAADRIQTDKTRPALAFKISITGASSNALFQRRATEQWQDKKICEDIDDASRQDHKAETLRRRKIRQHKDSKSCGDDHVGINNSAPLFFASNYPGVPAFLSVALRSTDPENEMNHRIDRNADADVRGRRRDNVHRHM